MLIDNESMIILEGNICSDLVSGNISVETSQNIVIHNAAENSFIRNNPVIQCISPAFSDGSGKLKISVMNREIASADFKSASLKFSRECECRYEVRCQNQTVADGECIFSEMRVLPSDTEGKLELEFVSESAETDEKMISDFETVSMENKSETDEITTLEQNLVSELEKKQMLDIRKKELNIQIDQLRSEVESMNAEFSEYSQLISKHEILKKNLEEISENIERISRIKKQLDVYDDILQYYKTENGYSDASESIRELIAGVEKTENYISELAQRRSKETDSISDELNM